MADPWFRFNMGSKWSWRELSLRLVANHLSLSLSSFVWWWWVINQGSEMNENTTVLVGNWLRPKKKRRKKKDPAAQQKGYIHAGSLSLWVLITPLLGLSSYLGWVLMDLSQSHMQILDESLSLFWFMMAWHKRMLTENFHMKLISQVNDRITTNCVKLYKDFFCFFFFRAISARGRRPLSTRCIWLSKQTVAGGHETISFWSETCLP